MGRKNPTNFAFKVQIDELKKTAVIEGSYKEQRFRYGIKLQADGLACEQFTKSNPDDFDFLSAIHRHILWIVPLDDLLMAYFADRDPGKLRMTDDDEDEDEDTPAAKKAYNILSSGSDEFHITVSVSPDMPIMELHVYGVLSHPNFHQEFMDFSGKMDAISRNYAAKTIDQDNLLKMGDEIKDLILNIVTIGYYVDVKPLVEGLEDIIG